MREDLRAEIKDLQTALRITTIMDTRDQHEAMEMADRIVVMSRGVIAQVGAPPRPLRTSGEPIRRGIHRPDESRAARSGAASRGPRRRARHPVPVRPQRPRFGLSIDIYGFWGIVISDVLYSFPHAYLILSAALAVADARLYESAQVLGATGARIFRDITLPSTKYGIMSAVFVVFTIVITDFGNPMVIGADYNVLATEIYNQVSGQGNFRMGAVIGVLMLIPAALAVVGCLRTLWAVTLPIVSASIVSVGLLFFVRSTVTLSAVIFLVTPATQLAAVSVLLLDDSGNQNQAAAFSVCIMAVVALALALFHVILRLSGRRNVSLVH